MAGAECTLLVTPKEFPQVTGSSYSLTRNGTWIGYICRELKDGRYHPIGEAALTRDDIDAIGGQIDLHLKNL